MNAALGRHTGAFCHLSIKGAQMTKHPAGDGQNTNVPEMKPRPPLEAAKRRGPGKSRAQAWAKIDAGKGTWKPK
jgi:hypothetical protein